jgi:hypothetical protein
MPDQMSVTIYNSAGEKVRQLYQGGSQIMPGGFSESVGAFEALAGSVSLVFPGQLQSGGSSLQWNGSNDGGQAVGAGSYTIMVSLVDAYGAVQTWTKNVTVLPQALSQSLSVYNSAGELVASLDCSGWAGREITQIGFSAASHATFCLGQGAGIPIQIQDSKGGSSACFGMANRTMAPC